MMVQAPSSSSSGGDYWTRAPQALDRRRTAATATSRTYRRGACAGMRGANEVIVVDSSSDGSNDEDDAGRRVVHDRSRPMTKARVDRSESVATTVVRPQREPEEDALTREERYILGADDSDDDDESAEDDDYDDGDDSFGDGARAFARKRKREAEPRHRPPPPPPPAKPTTKRSVDAATRKRSRVDTTRGTIQRRPRQASPPRGPSRQQEAITVDSTDDSEPENESDEDDEDDALARRARSTGSGRMLRRAMDLARRYVQEDDDSDESPPQRTMNNSSSGGPKRGSAQRSTSRPLYESEDESESSMTRRPRKSSSGGLARRAGESSRQPTRDSDEDDFDSPPKRPSGSVRSRSEGSYHQSMHGHRARVKLCVDTRRVPSDKPRREPLTSPMAARKQATTVSSRPRQPRKRQRDYSESSGEDGEVDAIEVVDSDESDEMVAIAERRRSNAVKRTPSRIRTTPGSSPSQSVTAVVPKQSQAELPKRNTPLKTRPAPNPQATSKQIPSTAKMASVSTQPTPAHDVLGQQSSQAMKKTPSSNGGERPKREQLFTESISIEELQAQEREWNRLKQQQKRRGQGYRGSSSRSRATASRGDKKRGRSSPDDSVEAKEPNPEASRAFIAPAARDGLAISTPPSLMTVTTVSAATDTANKHARGQACRTVPLMHTTTWRRLRFANAPLNLVPGKSKLPRPYENGHPGELSQFDESRTLETKAKVLAILGASTRITNGTNYSRNEQTQEEVNSLVEQVISESLPFVQACHRRRVNSIIENMRASLPWAARRATTRPAPRARSSIKIAPIERVIAKRVLQHVQEQPAITPNRLVGKIRFISGVRRRVASSAAEGQEEENSDDAVTERFIFPETVVEFGQNLAPMRRACTWISVKTNIHVEDDPILRYVPYIGQHARVNIDPKRYQSTTLNKDRALVIDTSNSSNDPDASTNVAGDIAAAAELHVAAASALDDDVLEYLLRIVVKSCGDTEKVFSALKSVGGFAQPYTDYCEIKKRHDGNTIVSKRLGALRRVLSQDGQGHTGEDSARQYLERLTSSSWFLHSSDRGSLLATRLKTPMTSFDSSYLRYPQGKGLRRARNYGLLVEWYKDLFCRRCYTYDCQQHGIQHPQPSRRSDPVNPVVRTAGVALSRRAALLPSSDPDQKDANDSSPVLDVIDVDETSSSSDDNGSEDSVEHLPSEVTPSINDEDEQPDESRRRSRRSQTRVSSLASASLQKQEVIAEQERRRALRRQERRLKKLVRAVDDSEYYDDSYLPIVSSVLDKLIVQTNQEGPDSGAETNYCSRSCWKMQQSDAPFPEQTNSDHGLGETEVLLLRKLSSTVGDNACILARVLESCECRTIHRFLEAETRQRARDIADGTHPSPDTDGLSSSRRKSGSRRSTAGTSLGGGNIGAGFGGAGGNRELLNRTRMQRHQDKGLNHSYTPCNHDGMCDGCDCMRRDHCCENACSCSRDCPNRFQGCKCSMGTCRTRACPCFAANRECDPDVCISCGASDAAVIAWDKLRSAPTTGPSICGNVNLLLGRQKKIGVAFSATHGWGAYALEPIRKGEFVYEYTGSLISDDEAERRGNIYDAMCVSFLFDVNSDEVVDAMRQGNKIKFANHRPREAANLDTQIFRVRGEHRIALTAKWDLEVGEELFFDYGYTNETAPGWSQVRAPHNTRYNDEESDLDEDSDDDGVEVLGWR